jgi:Flp pilus assembly CpaF family ATPase
VNALLSPVNSETEIDAIRNGTEKLFRSAKTYIDESLSPAIGAFLKNFVRVTNDPPCPPIRKRSCYF